MTRSGVPESSAAAARVLNVLAGMPRITGLPHEDSTVEFTDVATLAELCRARAVAILYLAPGLLDVDESVANALSGVPTLTVSATAEGVSTGIILGFELVGSKPLLVVNLTACRRQGVRLSSDLLKIATVIE